MFRSIITLFAVVGMLCLPAAAVPQDDDYGPEPYDGYYDLYVASPDSGDAVDASPIIKVYITAGYTTGQNLDNLTNDLDLCQVAIWRVEPNQNVRACDPTVLTSGIQTQQGRHYARCLGTASAPVPGGGGGTQEWYQAEHYAIVGWTDPYSGDAFASIGGVFDVN